MARKESIKIDRYLVKIANDKDYINHTYEELVAMVKEALGYEVTYDMVKYAIGEGEFKCKSTRGSHCKKLELEDRIERIETFLNATSVDWAEFTSG